MLLQGGGAPPVSQALNGDPTPDYPLPLCRYLEDNFVAYMQKVVAAHRTQVGRTVD